MAVRSMVLGLALTAASFDVAADLQREIADACRSRLSKQGGTAVQTCVAEDTAAAHALQKYPATARDTYVRCKTQLRYAGWARVKACVDQNMEAEATLAAYPERYGALIQGCRIRMGAFGAHLVKVCVDRDIEAGKASGER